MRTYWTAKHYDKQGKLIWEQRDIPNILHDEGEEFMIKVCFPETASVPANYYIGLDARAALAEADTLATVTAAGEPAGAHGYAREAVASDNVDFTAQQDAGTDDWEAVTTEVTFTAAGGNWAEMDNIFLATTIDGTGKLICSSAMSVPRTVNDGETLRVTMTIRLA